MKSTGIISLLLIGHLAGLAQDDDLILHSKEGVNIGYKRTFITSCRKNYGAPVDNKLVTQICECRANLLDRRFPIKTLRSYNRKYKEDGIYRILLEDTALTRQMEDCAASSKNLPVFTIPAYKKSFIGRCVRNLQTAGEKPINDTLAGLFCSCAADILENRKMPLEKLDDMADPNSFLYNEVAYRCGSPYLEPSDFARDWRPEFSKDISGPADIDSVTVISVAGLHKVKITIGKETRIWLLDSGASDLLVSDDFLKLLQQQGVVSEMNFAGEGRYRLADNSIITCKRYKINSVLIGRFRVDNVIIASSRETKEFLVGKSVLNKFSQWILDNRNNLLILTK